MFSVRNFSGMSLIEVMVAVGVGSIVSLGMASLISQSIKGSNSVRASLDYQNFTVLASKHLTGTTDCADTIGNVVFDGSADVAVPYIQLGPNVADRMLVGNKMPGTDVTITSIFIQGPELVPGDGGVSLTENVNITDAGSGANVAGVKYITSLVIQAQRDADSPGGRGLKPVKIPVSILTNAATDVVNYCGGDGNSQTCDQIGGTLIPATATSPARCDISDLLTQEMGGCYTGGTFSLINGSCSSANPYTGGCNCPTGFAASTVISYKPGKSAQLVQKQCLNCAGAGGFDSGDNGNPLYDEDQLERDMMCLQDPSTCPCNIDPASNQCFCWNNPSDPNCSDPCFVYGNDSCECLQANDAANGTTTWADNPVCNPPPPAFFYGGPFP